MAGIKRRSEAVEGKSSKRRIKEKTVRRPSAPATSKKAPTWQPPKRTKFDAESESESDDSFGGLSDDAGSEDDNDMDEEEEVARRGATSQAPAKTNGSSKASKLTNRTDVSAKGNSSKESHAKQKVLVRERKASKPNADSTARSKELWERLRRKSHVPLEERKELVAELYDIITSRVKDFVFKHDSVRVIQTALKYASLEQRKAIAKELKGDYLILAESRYAKFLIGKLLVHGDAEIRDLIIPEFYGHVKRLIRHPEASWIVDDVYRTVATTDQKANLLREWYGPEFVIFKTPAGTKPTSDLTSILAESPEKRGPILQYLHESINQLVQKKTTGFTMLHDAMLQYYLNIKPGSSEASEFIELLKDDETGDTLKNLAFTKSGARLICLALAYANAKDRKLMLRFYKNIFKMLSFDVHGHMVILAAYDLIDDTVLTSKTIFPEMLSKDLSEEDRQQELLGQVSHLTARIPLLYLFAAEKPKWLLPEIDLALLKEIHDIRLSTSKKDPETRRKELVKAISPPLLEMVASNAEPLVGMSFGCQYITEVLLGGEVDKTTALISITRIAKNKPELLDSPAAGRMLKTLVQGGRYNLKTETVDLVEPPLGFDSLLYHRIQSNILTWATGPNSFVVVGLLEAEGFDEKDLLLQQLKEGRSVLEEAAEGTGKKDKRNTGAKILLERLEPA